MLTATKKEAWEMTREEYAEYFLASEERNRKSFLYNSQAELDSANKHLARAEEEGKTDRQLEFYLNEVAKCEREVRRHATARNFTTQEINARRREEIEIAIEDGEEIPSAVKAEILVDLAD